MGREKQGGYPRSVTLERRTYDLRWMEQKDGDELLEFARSLAPEDLLFLRMDLTRREAIDEWLRQMAEGRRVALLAEKNGEMVGYGSLNRRPVDWQRHLGEVRVIVKAEHRASGLGGLLAEAMFETAKEMGMTKVVVQMAREQDAARRLFQRLGFTAEALLADWIQDRDGKPHDLVIMSHDVTSLT